MSNRKRHNICILGSEASGKTCFIAALAVLGQVRGDRNFIIVAPEDTGTQAWLNALSRSLGGGTWPPSTTATTMYEFTLEYARVPFRTTIMDYSGEEFRRGFDNLDPESLTSLQEHLFQADAIFILLDPVADLDVSGTDTAGEKSREERLTALFNAVLKCAHMNESGSKDKPPGKNIALLFTKNKSDGKDKPLDKNVALLVTKADSVAADVRKRGAEALIKKAVPKFYETVQTRSESLDCFFISAVGGDNSAAGALPAPPIPIAPEGYEELFRWLGRRRKIATWWRFVRRAAPVLAVVLPVLAVLVGGMLLYQKMNLSKLRDSSASESSKADASQSFFLMKDGARKEIDDLMGNRIQTIHEELGNANSFPDVTRLRTHLEELSRYGNHTYSDELNRLSKKIDDRAEELHFERIRSSTGPAELLHNIGEYRKEYPFGRFKDEVDDLENKTHDRQDALQRQEINRIVPGQAKHTWVGFLNNKAAAVDGYRRVQAPAHLRERMEKASRLARLLASESDHNVTVLSARTLASDRPTLLIVTINEVEALRTESQDHTLPNWYKKGAIKWRPGDKVKIEWRYVGWYSDGSIAELESDALDSLKILSDATELKPSDKKDYLDQSKPPVVSISVEGIDDSAWVDFTEFIYPGGYWAK